MSERVNHTPELVKNGPEHRRPHSFFTDNPPPPAITALLAPAKAKAIPAPQAEGAQAEGALGVPPPPLISQSKKNKNTFRFHQALKAMKNLPDEHRQMIAELSTQGGFYAEKEEKRMQL